MNPNKAMPGDLFVLTPAIVKQQGFPLPQDLNFLIRMTGPFTSDGTFPFEIVTQHADYAMVDAMAHSLAGPATAVFHPDTDDARPH